MTTAQTRALEGLGSVYGVPEWPEIVDVSALFSTCRPITLEIGFGDGQHLQQLAADHPEQGFIGIEAYRPGIGRLLHGIADDELNNLRVLIGDAEEIVPRRFPRCSVQHILVLFPDPWPKKRHQKRRFINADTLDEMSRLLTINGSLWFATDHKDYLFWVIEEISNHKRFFYDFKHNQELSIRPKGWDETRYQAKAKSKGLNSVFIEFKRI